MRRLVLAGAACLSPSLALAGVVAYHDEASFAAAAPGATRYVVGGPPGNYGTSYSQGPATFTSPGTVNVFDDGNYGANVSYLAFFPSRATATLAPSAYAIGLTLGTFGGTDVIDISLNAVPVTTVTSAGAAPATFYVGFTDTDPITGVTLFDRTSSAEIDLLDFTLSNTAGGALPLPEPASLLLLGAGTLAALASRRRPAA